MLSLMTAALVAAQPAPPANPHAPHSQPAHAQHSQPAHAQPAQGMPHDGKMADCCKGCCKDMGGHDRHHPADPPKQG